MPQISAVEYVPDDIEAKQLRAIFDPTALLKSSTADNVGVTDTESVFSKSTRTYRGWFSEPI